MSVPQTDEKQVLSWSSIDALLSCHYQYTLRYVDRKSVAEDARRFIEGRALHNGLARWWRLSLAQKRKRRLNRCLLQGFDEEVANARIRWQGDQDKHQARERVLKAGRNALAVVKRERLFSTEPYVEEEFRTDFEGFHLIGRYDLLLYAMDGDLALVDYKYSESERSGNRLQLIIQAIGVQATHHVYPTVAGFLLCKGSTQRFRQIRFRNPETEVEKFRDKLIEAWGAYLRAPRAPRFNAWKCDWCSVKTFCQTYRDTHPSGGRGDIVYGNRIRIEL